MDVRVAALLHGNSDENIISHAFVTENLPDLHENVSRITLTFRLASGGGTQTRHFKTLDIPHPMILAGGGVYSGERPDNAFKEGIQSERDSRLLPAEEEYLPMVIRKSDAQQVIPRAIPATSKQKDKLSLSGATITSSLPLASSQGNPASFVQTKPSNPGPELLASSRELAGKVRAAAAEASSAWTPATGIALGAASSTAGISAFNAKVAYDVKTIARENVDLSRDVFEYTKKKDAAAATAAAATNTPSVARPSKSDSDSDNADSGVSASSSKHTSLRASRGRPTALPSVTPGRAQIFSPGTAAAQRAVDDGDLSMRPVLTSPPTLLLIGPTTPPGRLQPHDSSVTVPETAKELNIIFPAVSTHDFNARPPRPDHKPTQLVDGLSIEMNELLSLRGEEVMLNSAEQPQPGVHAYSHGHSTAKAAYPPSAEDSQVSKEERQGSMTLRDTSITTDAQPIARRSDVLLTASKAEAVGEVDNIYDASDHLSIQKDSTSSPDDQEQVQETEPELKTENEALPQQFEDQPSGMLSPAEFRRGSDSLHNVSAVVTVEEQDDPCISFGRESTGGKTASSTNSERAETGEVQLLISASDKDTSHDSAKNDEQEFEVEDSKIEESQIAGDDTVENEVEGSEVEDEQIEDEQIEDTGVDADSNDGEEPAIRGEPEPFSLGLHELEHARTV